MSPSSNPRSKPTSKLPSTKSTPPPSPLLTFFDPYIQSPDTSHRTLNQILSQSDSYLEYRHDFIQWLFPLPELSGFSTAPLITRQVYEEFRKRDELREMLRKGLRRMLGFYGFEMRVERRVVEVKAEADAQGEAQGNTDEDSEGKEQENDAPTTTEKTTSATSSTLVPTISPSPLSQTRFPNWVVPLNHNHLRITRIIRSLRVLGLEAEAQAFYDALLDVKATQGKISDNSVGFWTRAAKAPLWQTPDLRVVEWLREV